jgi:hypothetical protein
MKLLHGELMEFTVGVHGTPGDHLVTTVVPDRAFPWPNTTLETYLAAHCGHPDATVVIKHRRTLGHVTLSPDLVKHLRQVDAPRTPLYDVHVQGEEKPLSLIPLVSGVKIDHPYIQNSQTARNHPLPENLDVGGTTTMLHPDNTTLIVRRVV